MSTILPINIDDLLRYQGVESSRVELKSSWDEKTTGQQVLKTICALPMFSRISMVGISSSASREDQGQAILPPKV